MAKFEVISKPEYAITLSQEELDGLYALLGAGCAGETIRLLKLESLYAVLANAKEAEYPDGKFRSLAEYNVS